MLHIPTDTEIAEALDEFLVRHGCGPGTLKPPEWAIDAIRQLLAESDIVQTGHLFTISIEDYSQHATAIWNLACIAAAHGWDSDPRPINPEDSEP